MVAERVRGARVGLELAITTVEGWAATFRGRSVFR